MKLYQLKIRPDESQSEAENCDEWFSSLEAARRRRIELIKTTHPSEYRYGSDFAIVEVIFAKLPTRQLLLAVLNRRGYAASQRVVVTDYIPQKD